MKEKNCHIEKKEKKKQSSRIKKIFSEKNSLKKGILIQAILHRPYQ